MYILKTWKCWKSIGKENIDYDEIIMTYVKPAILRLDM